MVKFIFIRHGYSIYNKEKRFTGQKDIPLERINEVSHVSNASITVISYDEGKVEYLLEDYTGHLE